MAGGGWREADAGGGTQQTDGERAHIRKKRAGASIRLRRKTSIYGACAKTSSKSKCADVRDPNLAHCPIHDATETCQTCFRSNLSERSVLVVRVIAASPAGRQARVNSDLAAAEAGLQRSVRHAPRPTDGRFGPSALGMLEWGSIKSTIETSYTRHSTKRSHSIATMLSMA